MQLYWQLAVSLQGHLNHYWVTPSAAALCSACPAAGVLDRCFDPRSQLRTEWWVQLASKLGSLLATKRGLSVPLSCGVSSVGLDVSIISKLLLAAA